MLAPPPPPPEGWHRHLGEILDPPLVRKYIKKYFTGEASENGNIFSSKLKSLKPSEMLYLSDEKYSLFIYKYI